MTLLWSIHLVQVLLFFVDPSPKYTKLLEVVKMQMCILRLYFAVLNPSNNHRLELSTDRHFFLHSYTGGAMLYFVMTLYLDLRFWIRLPFLVINTSLLVLSPVLWQSYEEKVEGEVFK